MYEQVPMSVDKFLELGCTEVFINCIVFVCGVIATHFGGYGYAIPLGVLYLLVQCVVLKNRYNVANYLITHYYRVPSQSDTPHTEAAKAESDLSAMEQGRKGRAESDYVSTD